MICVANGETTVDAAGRCGAVLLRQRAEVSLVRVGLVDVDGESDGV